MRHTFILPVNSNYGAPLGRHTGPDYLDAAAGKVCLRRVTLNSGGYDKGGAYWGIGAPLWECLDRDGNGRIFRAVSRNAAKLLILADFPEVKFYR